MEYSEHKKHYQDFIARLRERLPARGRPRTTPPLRERILEQYGGACRCCGEPRREFLVIVSKYKRHQILQEGFPAGAAEVWCRNCREATKAYGACPHTRARRVRE